MRTNKQQKDETVPTKTRCDKITVNLHLFYKKKCTRRHFCYSYFHGDSKLNLCLMRTNKQQKDATVPTKTSCDKITVNLHPFYKKKCTRRHFCYSYFHGYDKLNLCLMRTIKQQKDATRPKKTRFDKITVNLHPLI